MATHIYRYKWLGVLVQQVNKLIGPSPATFQPVTPEITIDVSADDSQKEDLDEVMSKFGWSYVSTDPP